MDVANLTAYVTGSSTNDQDDRALPDKSIALLNSPEIKQIY